MPRYDAYCLRVWRGETGESGRWSCRLEHLPDGRHQRFGSLEELLAWLGQVLKGTVRERAAADPADAPHTATLIHGKEEAFAHAPPHSRDSGAPGEPAS